MNAEDPRGVRRLPFGNLELEWWRMPWLKVADQDGSFTKKAHIDLDPAGGANPTTTISLGGLERMYLVIEEVDVEPLNPFSIRNVEVATMLNDRPLNRWGQFDETVSPGPAIEAEFALDQLFVVPPGSTYHLVFTNFSPFGRGQFDARIKGWLARRAN